MSNIILEDGALVLDWSSLDSANIDARITWLRDMLEPGKDWGYSPEIRVCVLMSNTASMLYKLTWFDTDRTDTIRRELIDRPDGLKLMNIDGTRG